MFEPSAEKAPKVGATKRGRVRLAWPVAGIGAVFALTLGLATNQPTWTLVVIPALMGALGGLYSYFWQVDDSLGIKDLRLSVVASVALVVVSAIPAAFILALR